jgi:hypothetical protein
LDIVAAHLFGLFMAIGLRENARAIAFSVQRRGHTQDKSLSELEDEGALLSDRAEREIQDRTARTGGPANVPSLVLRPMETVLGPIEIQIAEPLLAFARRFRQAELHDLTADILRKTDAQLDLWAELRRPLAEDSEDVLLPFGVELRLPRANGTS